MVEKTFLTDSRRDVLEGNADDLTEQSLRNAKSRIRVRSRLALDELIEVAESHEIENAEVFDPDDVFRLLSALVAPDEYSHPVEGPPEDYQAYRNRLHVQMDKLLRERHQNDETL
jgi:hypothetical protein